MQFPPRALEWTIGHSAGESSTNSDGLIIGPKRLMTRPEELEQYTLVARDFLDPHGLDKPIRRAVENTLPAELYICRLLQTFMALKRALPAQLAVTYPTTFSEREAQRLKEVIYRAHLRLQRKRQKSNSPSEEELRRVIALALDEASAAGLSFLQRHFLESPGALERFRYLYPRGFNLLLYDCGGGTTDIALIHAVSRETKRLEVEVLGRSGVREFGGDLITQEIFRLIKAQFARWLLENGALESAELRERLQHRETADAILGPFPAMKKNMPEGDYAAALRKYLDDNAKTIEAIVPTQFTPEGQTSSDRLNQIHVLELWRLAERLKMELVSSTNPKVTEVLTEGRLAATLRNRYFPRSAPSEDWLRLSVNRHEVDALIREWVDESVKCCNALILQKLIGWQEGEGIVQASDFGARQVDCVCVVGNGARYPLVMKMLRENLKIPFLDDEPPQEGVGPSPPQDPASPGGMRKFIFDDRFAKLGVAHGALMDMLYAQGCRGITVEFSKDFSKRIPFTLVWFDSNANTPRKLFFEGERYEELGVATIPAPPEVSEEGPPQERRSISLQQSWPGSNKPRSYVTFNFERPTEGAIDVSYNVERQQFRAVDEANQEGKPTYSVDHELYRSPVQRGTL